MVFSIHDPTEVAIQKMIGASQKMLKVNSQGTLGGGMSSIMSKHLELEIKTLETASRDADKLERLLQIKIRQEEKSAIFYPCLSFVEIEKRNKTK